MAKNWEMYRAVNKGFRKVSVVRYAPNKWYTHEYAGDEIITHSGPYTSISEAVERYKIWGWDLEPVSGDEEG